ncbi:hypothetical protein [Piscirickettsia salmonis]|uniref:hypothetical protein n=1 Tax=Piscirickettsia salmonis TaxID=1238 RepID=UPI0012D9C58F|nr:hypothetical protein [Piscirickettsia salmonis]QHS25136.1 hypothetical protein GW538_03285 [Piscirickettsia salmonis]QHS28341.1 hypothetical protein GW537_03275 [Piscirickettsia salmonis]
MLGDFASLDVQNTYRGSDAYELWSNYHYGNKKSTVTSHCRRNCCKLSDHSL